MSKAAENGFTMDVSASASVLALWASFRSALGQADDDLVVNEKLGDSLRGVTCEDAEWDQSE